MFPFIAVMGTLNLQKPLKSDIQEHMQLAMVSQIVWKQLLLNLHNCMILDEIWSHVNVRDTKIPNSTQLL
jgi:hypothetical protein